MNIEQDFIQEFKNQVRDNRNTASRELSASKVHGHYWNAYHSESDEYEEIFHLPRNYFKKLIENFRRSGINPHGLDVCSDPSFLASIGLPGVSVGLADPRTSREKAGHDQKNVQMVTGDILLSPAWIKIREYAAKHCPGDGFSLVTARPEGGLRNMTQNPAIHFRILQRMWSVLSSQNGVMLTQFDTYIQDCTLEAVRIAIKHDWLNKINAENGIKAKFAEHGIMMVKSKGAPQILPSPIIKK